VQIDQARRHKLPGGLEHTHGSCSRDVGFHSLNQPEADADVALATQALTWVEHVTAPDHQIKLIVWPNGCTTRLATYYGERKCPCRSKKPSA
jgi:hypothetical protein